MLTMYKLSVLFHGTFWLHGELILFLLCLVALKKKKAKNGVKKKPAKKPAAKKPAA